jgi:hypothetical protein
LNKDLKKTSTGIEAERQLGPPVCIECMIESLCNLDNFKSGGLADLHGNPFVCVRCLEARLHFDLQLNDVDDQVPLTIDDYLANQATRGRLGQCLPRFLRLRTFYRDLLARFWEAAKFQRLCRNEASDQNLH